MNFLSGSFRIGQLFGINIRIHILFVLWIGFQLISAGNAVRSEALFWGMLFGIVLLHELGHCFGARSVGGDARDIMMWPLGGLAFARAPMRPWPQFVTVAAGPLVNVALCALSAVVIFFASGRSLLPGINPLHFTFFHIAPLLDEPPPWFHFVLIFYHVNLWLLAFNLLPIYPLDGGQLFQAIIWPFVGLQRATFIACYVGITGCVMLAVWGIQSSEGMLIFIAIFGGLTCFQRLKMLRYGMIAEDSGFDTYDYTGRYARRRSIWTRVWRRLFRTTGADVPRNPARHGTGSVSPNPNPGAWQAKLEERAREEEELDRILKKVSEHGVQSLSYVERQTLERVTRRRQAEERDFQRDTRL